MYILNVYEQPYYMCIPVLLLASMASILWLH